MDKGIILEDGFPEEIFENPKMDYTKKLLSSVPGKKLAALDEI